jgi:predicted small lipoprotein YifL
MDRASSDGERIANIKANSSCGCFGGLYCDESIRVENPDGGPYLGHIVKEKPDSLRQFTKELIGKSDVYTLYMKKDLEVQKKASLLASVLYLDYKYFENDKAAKCDLGSCKCKFTLCILTCCGLKAPIKYPIRRLTTNDDEEEEEEEEPPEEEEEPDEEVAGEEEEEEVVEDVEEEEF